MHRPVPHAVLLSVLFAFPCPPAPGGDCLSPDRVAAERREEADGAARRAALLRYKASAGLFDLRLCAPDDGCPLAAEMTAERDAILAAARVDQARLVLATARNATDLAVADTLLDLLRSPFTKDKETLDLALAGLKLGVEQSAAWFVSVRGEVEAAAKQSRSQIFHAAVNLAYTESALVQLERWAGRGRGRTRQIEWRRGKLLEANQRARAVLDAVRGDYLKNATALAELDRLADAYQRATQLFDRVSTLATALDTMHAASQRDLPGTARSLAAALGQLAGWSAGRLAGDEAARSEAVKTAIHHYVIASRRRGGVMDERTASQFLAAIDRAQGSRLDAERAARLLSGARAGLDFVGSSLSLLDRLQKEYRAAAAELDRIQARRQALSGMTSPLTRDALTYFRSISALVRQLAQVPGTQALEAVLSTTADELELVAEAGEAMVRFEQRRLQGGRLTETMEFQGLHPLFERHPALAGLKVFVAENGPDFLIPDGRRVVERRLAPAQLDELLAAASTLTSLTLRPLTQDDLYDLANDRIEIDVPVPGAADIDVRHRVFDRARLTDPSGRAFEEREVGAVLLELDFLNRALDFRGERFTAADVLDPARRRALNGLHLEHLRLADAWRIAYGGELPAATFGAILAGSTGGPRIAASVSPLERRLLERRNRRLDAARAGPPLRISWLEATQAAAGRIEIAFGIEGAGLAPSARVCRSATVVLPDGSTAAARTLPAAADADPWTARFVLEGLDWTRLALVPAVEIEAAAEAGATRAIATTALLLEPPVKAELALVVPAAVDLEAAAAGPAGTAPAPAPDGATPGYDIELPQGIVRGSQVRLTLLSGVSSLLPDGVEPEVTFLVTPGGRPPVEVRASRKDEKNGVALFAEATWDVPEDLDAGQTVSVEGRIRAAGAESAAETSFTVLDPAATGIEPFRRSLTVAVRGERPGLEPAAYPPLAGARVTLGEQTVTTDARGEATFGPFEPADGDTFTAEAAPPEGDPDHAGGSGSFTFRDFDPDAPDPNRYRIEIVLAHRPRADPARAGAAPPPAAGSEETQAPPAGPASGGNQPPAVAAAIRMLPAVLDLAAGEGAAFQALVFDAAGNLLPGAPVEWTARDPRVATVDRGGGVRAVAAGTTDVVATSGRAGVVGHVRVRSPGLVCAVRGAPGRLAAGGAEITLAAECTTSAGAPAGEVALTWSSSDPSVAAIFSPDGRLVTGEPGSVTVTLEAAAGEDRATATAAIEVEARWREVLVSGTVRNADGTPAARAIVRAAGGAAAVAAADGSFVALAGGGPHADGDELVAVAALDAATGSGAGSVVEGRVRGMSIVLGTGLPAFLGPTGPAGEDDAGGDDPGRDGPPDWVQPGGDTREAEDLGGEGGAILERAAREEAARAAATPVPVPQASPAPGQTDNPTGSTAANRRPARSSAGGERRKPARGGPNLLGVLSRVAEGILRSRAGKAPAIPGIPDLRLPPAGGGNAGDDPFSGDWEGNFQVIDHFEGNDEERGPVVDASRTDTSLAARIVRRGSVYEVLSGSGRAEAQASGNRLHFTQHGQAEDGRGYTVRADWTVSGDTLTGTQRADGEDGSRIVMNVRMQRR